MRLDLAALAIDDRPTPGTPYTRNDWPTWLDLDNDGCDTRDEVLYRDAVVTPFVGNGCTPVGGEWVSTYDDARVPSASELDVDHVVALEQAHRSGGWRWEAAQRAMLANDERNLVAVTAATNRSKGSATPDQWRPPARGSWCVLATITANVKATYGLTVTTAERDALGQMFGSCSL